MLIPKIFFCRQRVHERVFSLGAPVPSVANLVSYERGQIVYVDVPPDALATGWRIYGTGAVWTDDQLDGSASWHSLLRLERACVGGWNERWETTKLAVRWFAELMPLTYSLRGRKLLRDGTPRDRSLAGIQRGAEHPVASLAEMLAIKFGDFYTAAGVTLSSGGLILPNHSTPPTDEQVREIVISVCRQHKHDGASALRAYQDSLIRDRLSGLSPDLWRQFFYSIKVSTTDDEFAQAVSTVFA